MLNLSYKLIIGNNRGILMFQKKLTIKVNLLTAKADRQKTVTKNQAFTPPHITGDGDVYEIM